MLSSAHREYPDQELSWTRISDMLACIEPNLRCPVCDVQMHMISGWNRGDIVSLQHYRNGGLGLLCNRCNGKHGSAKLGDAYLFIDRTREKFCSKCDQVKSLDAFLRIKSAPDGFAGICRECNRQSCRERQAWRQPKTKESLHV